MREASDDLVPSGAERGFVLHVQRDAADVALVDQAGDCGLEDYRIAEFAGGSDGLVRCGDEAARVDGDAIAREQCLRLRLTKRAAWGVAQQRATRQPGRSRFSAGGRGRTRR